VGSRRHPGVITLLARPGSLAVGATVALEPEEEHHLTVRRAPADAEIELVDGAGARAGGRLIAEGRQFRIRVERLGTDPPLPALVLAVGAGDRDRFGSVVDQAAQLGVTRVVPLETARSANVATRLREAHLERLRRRAREAIKQCGSAWAPAVEAPRPLAAFLAEAPSGACWLGDEAGETPGLLAPTDPVTIAVGPEGGFTTDERSALLAAGFQPVRFGPHRLRFETAALAALTTAWLRRQRDRHA
jgi:16S rRNA (uracil1498-N3)-methyltransferase